MTMPAPFTGASRHAPIPMQIAPSHDIDSLMTELERATEAFLATVADWRATAGSVASSYNPASLSDSSLTLKRSPKSRKIVFTESRKQDRSAHQKLNAAGIKAEVIDRFAQLETAILSIPALAHKGWDLSYRTWRPNDHQLSLQKFVIGGIYSYKKEEGSALEKMLERLSFLARALAPIDTRPDAPLWIVGPKLIPANSAEEALFLHSVLDAAKGSPEHRLNALRNPKTVLIGRAEPGDATKHLAKPLLEQACAHLEV